MTSLLGLRDDVVGWNCGVFRVWRDGESPSPRGWFFRSKTGYLIVVDSIRKDMMNIIEVFRMK